MFRLFLCLVLLSINMVMPLINIATKEPLISGMHFFQRVMVTMPAIMPHTAVFSLHLNPQTAKRKGGIKVGLLISVAKRNKRSRALLYRLVYNASKMASIPMAKQATLAK